MKRLISVMLICIMLCSVFLSSHIIAADNYSIAVSVFDDSGDPVGGISTELMCVALQSGSGYSFTSDFSSLPYTPAEVSLLSSVTAEEIYQYIISCDYYGDVLLTSDAGLARFGSLERGIYIVFERGNQAVTFDPFLVALPTITPEGEQEHVICSPKISDTDTKSLLVSVLWDDNMNAEGKRPSSVKVTLSLDGVAYRQVILNDANMWMYTFSDLPLNGNYSVKQESVSEYTTEVQSVHEGFIITNKYVPPYIPPTPPNPPQPPDPPDPPQPPEIKPHLTVRKVWDDNNNAAGKRPAFVTVQLICGTEVLKTANLSDSNLWEYTFDNLDKGKAYTVLEIAVSNYSASYSGNASSGITITNKYTAGGTDPGTNPDPIVPTPETTDIPIVVKWADNDNSAQKRPDKVLVHLMANGGLVSSITITAEGDWKGTFKGVPADYSYTVWQQAVTDYSTTYSGSASQGFIVTNTYTDGKTDPGTPPPPTPPDKPDEPDPDKPDKPDKPNIPQTGADMMPIFILLAVGISLILAGIVVLLCKRRKPQ